MEERAVNRSGSHGRYASGSRIRGSNPASGHMEGRPHDLPPKRELADCEGAVPTVICLTTDQTGGVTRAEASLRNDEAITLDDH